MKITHCWDNGPEYLKITEIDDVFSDRIAQEFFSYKHLLEAPEDTGSARGQDNLVLKENSGIFLNKLYTDMGIFGSPSFMLLDEVLKICLNLSFSFNSSMNYIKNVSNVTFLLSGYKNNDYYLPHDDSCTLTALFWVTEKNYKGGDFTFTDFNHTITPEKNTGIIFPSHYRHEVDTVISDSEDFVRVCESAFLAC